MFGIDDAVLATVGTGIANNLFANQRQSAAQDFSANQFANRYQTTVKDMEAAGLNPMLAYSQGGGSAPTSSAASSQGIPDVGESVRQSRMNSAQVANVEADTQNKRSQAHLIDAQANLANASADQARTNINLQDFQAKKISEELKNIPKEGERLEATVRMLGEQADLMMQQGVSQATVRQHIDAMIRKLASESSILEADFKAIQDTHGFGRIAREVKPISDIGADWISPSKLIDRVMDTIRSSSSSSTRKGR